MKREAGVYQILNKVNGKRYVGSSVDVSKRWREHRNSLHRGEHANLHLQRAWALYTGQFAFSVLEYVPEPERLTEREQHYIDTLRPEYNIAPVAGSTLGKACAENTKAKISLALTGRPLTTAHRAKLQGLAKGHKNANAKLSEQQVVEIRQLLAEGAQTRELAARYGVTQSAICNIKSGHSWVHTIGRSKEHEANCIQCVRQPNDR